MPVRLIVLLLLALAAAACDRQKADRQQGAGAAAGEAVAPAKGVDRSHRGQRAPAAAFTNPDGGAITLAAFKGVPVLVNLWATWCAPCIKELPTLDALARSHDDDGQLGVVALNQDRAPHGSVKAFLTQHNIAAIGAFHDPEMRVSGALDAQILPTSVLFDRDGREVWRYVGDLDWTGEEANKLIAEAR